MGFFELLQEKMSTQPSKVEKEKKNSDLKQEMQTVCKDTRKRKKVNIEVRPPIVTQILPKQVVIYSCLQVYSLSQPESTSKRTKKTVRKTKESNFQLRDEDLPSDQCPPLPQEMATLSSAPPVMPPTEAHRSSLWAVFGLQPPPFPVGCPPPQKNEKKSCTALDERMRPLHSTLDDPNVSKERRQGILHGSKDVYAMFGLPVPKWIEDGLDYSFDLESNKASTSNVTKKTP